MLYQTRMQQIESFLPIPEDFTIDKACKEKTVYDAFVENGDLFKIDATIVAYKNILEEKSLKFDNDGEENYF